VALSAGASRPSLLVNEPASETRFWLYPEAFPRPRLIEVLYVVTRGALVPEMARTDQFREHAAKVGESGWPARGVKEERGFAGFNAQLSSSARWSV